MKSSQRNDSQAAHSIYSLVLASVYSVIHTSSLPCTWVMVDVFTMGSSIPSMSTQFPAGTRLTSMLYL